MAVSQEDPLSVWAAYKLKKKNGMLYLAIMITDFLASFLGLPALCPILLLRMKVQTPKI